MSFVDAEDGEGAELVRLICSPDLLRLVKSHKSDPRNHTKGHEPGVLFSVASCGFVDRLVLSPGFRYYLRDLNQ